LNSDYQRIPNIAEAVWPDDVLDIRLDRVVIADIDGVTGFQHMLDRGVVITVTSHRDCVAAAKVAAEIGQQELVSIASRNYALPNCASESHEGKQGNVLLWGESDEKAGWVAIDASADLQPECRYRRKLVRRGHATESQFELVS